MLLAGFLAGNPLTTILLRALAGLCCGLVAGYAVGLVSQVIVDESFKKMVEADAKANPVETSGEAEEKPAHSGPERIIGTLNQSGNQGVSHGRSPVAAEPSKPWICAVLLRKRNPGARG